MGSLAATRQPPAEAGARNLRVVLADDSETVRWLGTNVLSRAGITHVSTAKDGPGALALIDAEEPDCIVLDVQMPGMTGFEVLAELRLRCPAVPVVMLSGFVDQALAARALAGGAAAYLDKTRHLLRLDETVRKVTSAPVTMIDPAVDSSLAPPPDALHVESSELREFEYAVSHDLAAPLRAISGFAALLHARYGPLLDETGQSFLDHILAGSREMQAMEDDLLIYTRAGRTAPRLETVGIDEIAAATFAALDDEVRERGVEASAGELPTVLADRDMITTVLRHLVRNGMIFNTSAEPAVRVDGYLHDEMAIITVTDNGIGMNPAHADRAFRLFGRLNAPDDYPGTGTGLALCRRLMSLQDGTIEIGTSPGQGTTVTLTLPANDHRERPK